VRDCHGDLRAEHVIVDERRVEVFDPVEFDPALREIDVSADLAFLVMDLMRLGADGLARVLIDEYMEAGADCGGSLCAVGAPPPELRPRAQGAGRGGGP
jgi:aminoglycoside phosphotransferase family enzyme